FATGVEPQWIGRNCLWQAQEHADRIMDFREKFGEDRIVDVHYAELTRKPIDTMRALYGALGDEFSADVEERMQSWLDENPQDK
ncbi:sulfotransferase, partial [Klebsiella pneumoniae]